MMKFKVYSNNVENLDFFINNNICFLRDDYKDNDYLGVIIDYQTFSLNRIKKIIEQEEKNKKGTLIFIVIPEKNETIIKEVFSLKITDIFLKPFVGDEVKKRLEMYVMYKQKSENLSDVNEQKNRFIGIATHDLRNPLQHIAGYAEILKNELFDILNINQKKYFRKIINAVTFMNEIIKDMLDISNIESGKIDYKSDKMNIHHSFNVCCEFNHERGIQKKIDFKYNITDKVPEIIYSDRYKIEQIFNNIIGNAIKFCREGDKVEVELDFYDNSLIFQVTDTGPGIPESEHKKMFEYFSRTSVKPSAGEGSTGLGLAIVKKLVSGFSGNISFTSKRFEGTSFKISIPVLISERE